MHKVVFDENIECHDFLILGTLVETKGRTAKAEHADHEHVSFTMILAFSSKAVCIREHYWRNGRPLELKRPNPYYVCTGRAWVGGSTSVNCIESVELSSKDTSTHAHHYRK
jgi:hypothetical protein